MSPVNLRSRIKVQFLDKHALNFLFRIFPLFIRIFTNPFKAEIVSSLWFSTGKWFLKIFVDSFLETGDIGVHWNDLLLLLGYIVLAELQTCLKICTIFEYAINPRSNISEYRIHKSPEHPFLYFEKILNAAWCAWRKLRKFKFYGFCWWGAYIFSDLSSGMLK